MAKQDRSIDGILNIDKPYGVTSMDVVRRLKRAGRVRRIGHGGTLDPVATGVVPICMGQATRVMEYLVDDTKESRALIELGVTTDTYDSMGQRTGSGDPAMVARADLEHALESFSGVTQQVPPMYSALKKQGKRLYDLARSGIEVERESRRVEVFRIDLTEWSPPLVTVEVSCGRGFYMRSLAHDLGQALGCGAHLKGLVRLRSGPFEISSAISVEEGERRLSEGAWRELLHAPDVVLHHVQAAIVGKRTEEAIRHGRPLPAAMRMPQPGSGESCRAYSIEGEFVAVLSFDAASRRWRPNKVFAPMRREEQRG